MHGYVSHEKCYKPGSDGSREELRKQWRKNMTGVPSEPSGFGCPKKEPGSLEQGKLLRLMVKFLNRITLR